MKTKEPLKVGIVGCGKIAQKRHIPSLLKIKNAELVAACDKNGDLAGRVARGFHISRYYTDLSEMLKKNHIDVVHVFSYAFSVLIKLGLFWSLSARNVKWVYDVRSGPLEGREKPTLIYHLVKKLLKFESTFFDATFVID